MYLLFCLPLYFLKQKKIINQRRIHITKQTSKNKNIDSINYVDKFVFFKKNSVFLLLKQNDLIFHLLCILLYFKHPYLHEFSLVNKQKDGFKLKRRDNTTQSFGVKKMKNCRRG